LGLSGGSYLNRMNPSFRFPALRTLQQQTDENIERLLTGLSDATKAVRTESIQRLMQAGEDQIPEKYKEAYNRALEEYRQVLFFNADFPTGKINLANFYYNQNQFKDAEKYYKAALEQDSELRFLKLNLAYLYNRTGQNNLAERFFREYIQEEPEDADALFSFALLLTETGKYDESLSTLLKVKEMAPDRPRVNHNIAMMYDFMKDKKKAEEFLKDEISVIDNLNSRLELLRFYLDNNYSEKALTFAYEMLEVYPDAGQVQQVVTQLENSLRGN